MRQGDDDQREREEEVVLSVAFLSIESKTQQLPIVDVVSLPPIEQFATFL